MFRTKFGKVLAGGAVSLAMLAWASQAEAGWRWHGSHGGSSGGGSSGGWGGSSGGSSGGWGGSSGGSSGGSWGGSGGSWGGHWHKHWKRHASWGSSGGSWGGSSGGSSGGWGSSGGSAGGSYYMPMEVSPDSSVPAPAAPAPGAAPAAPLPGQSTSLNGTNGMLAVNVPEEAKIFVNGQPTTSTGGLRQYVSRDLQNGFNYTYEVRAELVRDGRTIEQVKKVDLRAGEVANVSFDFPTTESVETSLTVHVPADAKVYLAGNATKASGETRIFRTTGLTGGKAWDSYTVRVELERGGETMTKEETITLKAGESKELRFDFEGDKVAAAR